MRPGQVVSPNRGEEIRCIASASQTGRFKYEVTLAAGSDDSPPSHAHDEPEEVEILEGELIFEIEGEEHLLKPGDRRLIPPGTFHTFRLPKGSSGMKGKGAHGPYFERLVDQFGPGGGGFLRLAAFLSTPEGRVRYRVKPGVRAVVSCAALLARLSGVRPL